MSLDVKTPEDRTLVWSARVLLCIALLATWFFTLLRAIPLRNGDRGVFVSMAERLAAGDTLYLDVWDNKEPLFFLTLAAGRILSPAMDVALELLWIALSALAVYVIAKASGGDRSIAIISGFIMTPIILTGSTYYAGFSHLPATAVFLGITALARTRHFGLAGALIPVLALFKIIMLPMGLAVLLVSLLLVREKRSWLGAGLGTLISTIALSVLLLARGEFIGFIKLVWSNIGYSQQPLGDAYQIPIWQHIEPVMTAGSMITVCASILAVILVRGSRGQPRHELRLHAVWALGAAALITAITGLWEHHGQVFYGPAALAGTLALVGMASMTLPWISILMSGVLAAIVLSGGLSTRTIVDTGLSGPTRYQDLFRLSESAQDIREFDSSTSYMRLGRNTDDSHAYGLRDYTFACYQFVQYYYDIPATLEYIPKCLPQSDVVIVDNSLTPEDGRANWNEFIRQSEQVLADQFVCEERSYGRLCMNQAVNQRK